jgi:hypothetical protein
MPRSAVKLAIVRSMIQLQRQSGKAVVSMIPQSFEVGKKNGGENGGQSTNLDSQEIVSWRDLES